MGREPFAPHLIPVASPPPDGGSLHSTDFFDGDLTKKWGGNLDRLMVMTDAMRAPVGGLVWLMVMTDAMRAPVGEGRC